MTEISHMADLSALIKSFEGSPAITNVTFVGIEWQDAIDAYNFSDCSFRQVKFRCDEISYTEFENCVFEECQFDSCRIRESRFKHCQFYDRETEKGCSFKFCDLTASQFLDCDLSMSSFARANLYRAELVHCQAQGIDMSYLTLESSIGGKVVLNGAVISDCNLAYADFTGAQMTNCEFNENRLSHGILNEANFSDASMQDCELHNIEATGLTLTGSDLRGSNLDGLDIRLIDMTGVTIDELQQTTLLQAIGIIVVS